MLPALFAAAGSPGEGEGEVLGRICSFPPEDGLQRLGVGRATVFAFGADTLDAVGADASPYETLVRLGLQPAAITRKVRAGSRFAAVAFVSRQHQQATWDGVASYVRAHYPAAADDVARLLPALREAAVDALEATDEFRAYLAAAFEAAGRQWPTPQPLFRHLLCDTPHAERSPGYVSYERFCAAPQPRSLLLTRAFLYCELRLLELFAGDGHTLDATGRRGPREYLCPNLAIGQGFAVEEIDSGEFPEVED